MVFKTVKKLKKKELIRKGQDKERVDKGPDLAG